MIAAWYDRQGSGVNPGDTKKRRGWLGSTMPYPRVIPHSDAAGVPQRRP